jgi:hypothetical protein
MAENNKRKTRKSKNVKNLEELLASGKINASDKPADVMEKFPELFHHVGVKRFENDFSKLTKSFDSKVDPSKINIKTLINDIYHSHRAIQ